MINERRIFWIKRKYRFLYLSFIILTTFKVTGQLFSATFEMKVFNLCCYLFEMKYGAIGCIHFYRQSARKFLLYSINQVEETINKNNYVLLILSLTENSYRYFSSMFHFFSPFDLIDYHILLREFDNCSIIIQLLDFLPIPPTVLLNDQSEFVLFPFQPSTPLSFY